MKSNIEVEELISVLEMIRAEQHPEIPSELIRDIVEAEFECADNRVQARKETKRLIDVYLKKVDEEVE